MNKAYPNQNKIVPLAKLLCQLGLTAYEAVGNLLALVSLGLVNLY